MRCPLPVARCLMSVDRLPLGGCPIGVVSSEWRVVRNLFGTQIHAESADKRRFQLSVLICEISVYRRPKNYNS